MNIQGGFVECKKNEVSLCVEISVICKLLNEVRPDGIVRFFKAKQPLNPPRLIDVRLAERVRLVKLRQVANV